MVLKESSRFFSARNGGAVINAVRFATSFFGKGQFVPDACVKEGSKYVFRQSLSAPYYQPLAPPQKVDYRNWGALREKRRQTQVCKLEQMATVTEQKSGFELRLQSNGTPGVPLAVEISLREGGKLEGCRPAPHVADGWILEKDFATYRVGGDTVRFGPGAAGIYSRSCAARRRNCRGRACTSQATRRSTRRFGLSSARYENPAFLGEIPPCVGNYSGKWSSTRLFLRLSYVPRRRNPVNFLTWRLHDSLPSHRAFPTGALNSGQAFAAMDRLLDEACAGPSTFASRPSQT